MLNINYFPHLKTGQAELKGYQNLSDNVKDITCPMFELTKSRISKHNPLGSAFKQIDKLKKLLDGRSCILDICQDPTYINKEMEEMITDGSNGYEKWCNFLENIEWDNIVPVLQFCDNASIDDDRNQIEFIDSHFQHYALKITGQEDDIKDSYDEIMELIPDKKKIILIIDYGFLSCNIDRDTFSRKVISLLESLVLPDQVIFCASSYPKYVKQKGYGDDRYGKFDIIERDIFNRVTSKGRIKLFYGDYATVHPIRYNTPISNGWIARVDYPLEDAVFYYRDRAPEYSDAYSNAAKKVMDNDDYDSLESWGNSEIITAAQEKPNGKSPSHWIAVRINIHIERQALINN